MGPDPEPVPKPNADPDPFIFIIALQNANKKTNFSKSFSAYYSLKVLLHHFSKVKNQKSLKTIEIMAFLSIFACW
jgi:hypothetical protein